MRRLHYHAARGTGLVLHRLATLALGVAVIGLALLAASAWRLSQGPVDLAWLNRHLEQAVNANGGPIRLSIGGTALAWEGFRLGVDRPLDLRLTGIRLTTVDGSAEVTLPRAEVSLSLSALLLGRVQPRALELDDPRLSLIRAADGTISIGLGGQEEPGGASKAAATDAGNGIGEPLPALLAVLARPPATDTTVGRGWYRQLQRVRVDHAVVTVTDRSLGVTWRAPMANVALRRLPRGGIEGTMDISLVLAGQTARLAAAATVSPGASQTDLTARLSPVTPAALARAAPRLGSLAAIDAPVGAEATAELGPSLDLEQARVTLQAGAGTLHVGAASLPMVDASVTASGTPGTIRLDAARLSLRPRPGAAASTLAASGTIRREAAHIDADLDLGLDRVGFADLPALWPSDIAHDARAWIVENITGGVASNGQVSLSLAANDDFSDLTLTRATGSLQGSDLTVSWLRPVPPIGQGKAVLHVIDPDTLEIDIGSGQQALKGASLAVTGGTIRISGLMQRKQIAEIHASVAGALPDVITLLREPRLQLLSRHPVSLDNPSGDVTATVAATVPLDARVTIDDIAIRVAAHIDNAGLSHVVAGRDLSNGTLDVAADNDGLTVKGNARLAAIPAVIDGAMDFRAGPPSQVVQRVTVSGETNAKALAAAGLDTMDTLSGPMGLQAVLTEHRDGTGSVALDADLHEATLMVSALNWRRALGAGARAKALILLRQDRLDGIDGIDATGDGVALRGSVNCSDGRIASLQLDRVVLGRSDMRGSVVVPASRRAGPIAVRLEGPTIDLSAYLAQPRPGRHPRRPEPPPGPPWTLDAAFNQALMAHNYLVAPLRVQAEDDGRVFQRLHVDGATRDKGSFSLQIAPAGDGHRRLTMTAAQAGDLLRALDVTDTMQGGSLSVSGSFDDASPNHPLNGTADLTDFHVAHAVALGKLLQAMTLYGLRDALRGPGLAFSRLVAPFSLSDDLLTLSDARAFSASLGLTAKGQIDLDGNSIDLKGTIVPAYFFNSLLGNVPLVGRLFSPERGGGVFAASYSLSGNLDDPAVRVNPLTALTPGFLRGLFGLF